MSLLVAHIAGLPVEEVMPGLVPALAAAGAMAVGHLRARRHAAHHPGRPRGPAKVLAMLGGRVERGGDR